MVRVGDLVTRKSHNHDITFCIIGFRSDAQGRVMAILKALYNATFIVDAPLEDLVSVLPERRL